MIDSTQIGLAAIEELGIRSSIRNLVIESAASPWSEKIIVDGRDPFDVKATIWHDEKFIAARIYRLLLYVADVLNPAFLYSEEHVPDRWREPSVRRRYNQIWALAVDSRIERRGMENFYDKTLRRNLFCEMETGHAREKAAAVFEVLWKKDSFSFPEIIDHSRNLDMLLNRIEIKAAPDGFELDMRVNLRAPSVKGHLRRLSSDRLLHIVDELIRYITRNCKDTAVEPCYYGILIRHRENVFIELAPLTPELLFVSVFDAFSATFKTHLIDESSDISKLTTVIREMYNNMAPEERQL
ncbi:MAG TPA: hypothetical protein VMT62_00905 [Syntrophorhabdaceae bacterium]|nr:hypothetical protein [Syntrophorhabdaceae bacterium]